MDGVLNEATNEVHKHEAGESDFRTRCGSAAHVSHDSLRLISIERATRESAASRCSQCFGDGTQP
ncbi:hypothetical protein ACFO5R_03965 [Halosolutus amylolyticus]|uniref:Uncharacterized protein n=1 Tax=Halosolutus amylolyticus TaxID=2932267 RepID=A0ABD5PKK1_9EURY|nr:hypothetical protein [Halosolutus amylolyticus]